MTLIMGHVAVLRITNHIEALEQKSNSYIKYIPSKENKSLIEK